MVATFLKRAGTALVLLLVILIAAELACRLCFALLIGRSVLFYGTSFERAAVNPTEGSPLLRQLRDRRLRGVADRNNSARHTNNRRDGYAKYHPHQARSTYDAESGEIYPVGINSRGFRGPEFAEGKAAGSVRIITLGASSTFGYHARDDLTYPAQLQRILTAACPSHTFEVINLGIPHLTSDQILALFIAEGIALRPDVVTFYEGFNDASEFKRRRTPQRRRPVLRQWKKQIVRWTRERLLTAAFAEAVISDWTERYSARDIDAHVAAVRRTFLDNLDELRRLAAAERFALIVASQQARSLLVPREDVRHVTLADELELVAAELRERGSLGRKQAAFFAHGALLDAQAQWARRHGVTYVDMRAVLDARRDFIVSWVHLNHEGNRLVAEQLASAILPATCGEGNGGSRTTAFPEERR